MKIEAYQVDSFLSEKGFARREENDKTVYEKYKVSIIYVPNKEIFSTEEVWKFLHRELYEEFMTYLQSKS